MKSIVWPGLLLFAALLIQACSENDKSPEDEIREFIDAGVQAAESRSTDDLAGMAHENYIDHKGFNRKQLTGLLRGYFLRHKNIHLFTRIDAIEILDENRAEVRLFVAMAGNAISDVSALSSLRARTYLFELQLIKQERWLLRYARWSTASLADLE